MGTKERLIEFIEHKGISVAKFEKMCGLSNGYVNNLKGNYGGKKLDDILTIFPELNRDWLLKGEGVMIYDKKESVKYTYLVPMSAAGGSLVGFDEGGAMFDDCEKIVSPIDDVDFALPVTGDSMYPEYPAGSRVLVKRFYPEKYIAWGNVYVIDTPNGIVIKEVQPANTDDRIVCHSHNPNGRFKDFEINLRDVRAMYRVLACITMK